MTGQVTIADPCTRYQWLSIVGPIVLSEKQCILAIFYLKLEILLAVCCGQKNAA